MRLSDGDIESLLDSGQLEITPRPPAERISSVTVDLRLGQQFTPFRGDRVPYIDLAGPKAALSESLEQVMGDPINLPVGEPFFLQPHELVLAVTHEAVTIPDNLVGWLDGRSSLARLGLMVHATAHRIDPGWRGKIVLECYNASRITLALRPGMLIGALSFETLSSPALRPYHRRADAKYHGQDGAVGSRIHQD